MNLIQVSETTIINVDNVTHVERYEAQSNVRVFFAAVDGDGEGGPAQKWIDFYGDEALTIWERLCAAERSNAGPTG